MLQLSNVMAHNTCAPSRLVVASASLPCSPLSNTSRRTGDNFAEDHQVSAKSKPMPAFIKKQKHIKTLMRSIAGQPRAR